MLGILALVAVIWVGRVIVALLFFAIIIASAIRPSVEAMKRKRLPRGVGVLLHYALFFGLIALGLWSPSESSSCPKRESPCPDQFGLGKPFTATMGAR